MRADSGRLVAGRYLVTDRPASDDTVSAQDQRSGEPVLLHPLELPELLVPGDYLGEPDPEHGERIARQVLATDVPPHSRLLRGLDAVVEGEVLWVAEERLPGARLSELAEAGQVHPYRAAELGADLAGALRALHAAGLTHGNVTAESVLVCEDGAALLGGLLPGAAQEALCALLGGPVPQRVHDARALLLGARAERWAPDSGPAADCWALGVLLFRLLTGYSPYPEDDLPTLLAAIREGKPAPVDDCGPLGPLVEELLRPDPADRPDAAEVRRRLAGLLTSAPEPYHPAAALLPARREPAELAYSGRSRRPSVSRRPRIAPALLGPLLVGGVFLALVAALTAVVLLTN